MNNPNSDLPILGDVNQVLIDQYRLLVEAVKDYGIFILDPEGNVLSWNLGAEQIKGYKAEEIIGRHISIFYTREDIERGWPQHVLEIARQVGRFKDEGWRLRKDGSRFWANVVITALRGSGGELLGFSKITRDLSERKRFEDEIQAINAALEVQVRLRTEELQRTVEDLHRSNLDLEQFAYVASHDLQEPLRAVAGCVQILKRRYQSQLDARADELIGHTIEGVERMQTLIGDLLTYSRVGQGEKAFVQVDCNNVLAAAISNLEKAIVESHAVIESDPLPPAIGDASLLTLLFQNLIGNAIKFRSGRPLQIHIASEREEDHWRISIRDNGIGMQPEYFDRIFVIFQRLHTRTEYPGTGIGLAICKKIVERHGGHIAVESVPDQGSTFSFTLTEGGTLP